MPMGRQQLWNDVHLSMNSQYHSCQSPAMSVKVTTMAVWLTLLHAFLYPFPINPAHGSQGNHTIHMPTALKRIHCKIKAITQRKSFISYVIPLSLLHVHTSMTHKPPGLQTHWNLSDLIPVYGIFLSFHGVNYLAPPFWICAVLLPYCGDLNKKYSS